MSASTTPIIGVTKTAPGAGNVELRERERRPVGPGEAALDVRAVGICGTDLHIWQGEYPSVPPVTMGHEVCGTVAEVGPGVDEAWLGRRVVVETYGSTCGRCRHCRDGRGNRCADRKSIGTHVDGGMAARLVLPAHNLHEVPQGLSDAAASLAEPVACVCNSLLDPSAVQPGDAVLVIGPGPIGILAAQVARAAGGRVAVRGTERDAARLALAEQLGFATEVAGAGAGRDGGAPVDVVVECSGSEPGIRHGLEALDRGGTFVLMGLRGADVTVPFDRICFSELLVRSGFASTPASWRHAMRLIRAGALELEALVTDVLALTDWSRAFEAAHGGDGVKFVLDPRL
ncbi:MAG TPA: alcohol dehydrogenase catalytic domain-containing protein [Capillimicrobium sp.]|jgi:L-iditol 2-dehydrogenase